MTNVARLWRTVQHLKPTQIGGRLWFHVHRPRPDPRPAPPRRPLAGAWIPPAERAPSLVAQHTWRFLGEEMSLDQCGWDDPQVDRLWRYNLHYFDDLNASGARSRRDWHQALVARWIVENPVAVGTAWEPYPVSLRIVNWIKWLLGGMVACPDWLDSLALQVRWLSRRIEWHLLGNHLFANAKALVFAGLFFEGGEARKWLTQGLAIVRHELAEQVLADGGHIERSTMYHALALEDLLDLRNVIGALADAESPARKLEAALSDRASAMIYFLRCLSHPDGKIALFNDSADGVAPDNAELESYAVRLGIVAQTPPLEGITRLDPSGYIRVVRGSAVALLDVAPLGPDYLLGHAHADTLSFELSLGGRRLIVNGGTSCYGLSRQRTQERGTAWHSTVEVAGLDSSEVWSGFRVGRRARIVQSDVRGWDVVGAHDGYSYLRGAPLHQRCWSFSERGLSVTDTVGPGKHPAVARFHLAPGLSLQLDGSARQWRILDGPRTLAIVDVTCGEAKEADSHYAPAFGRLMSNKTLHVALRNGMAITSWRWT